MVTTQRPLIIGHRGASAVAPENTLSAFARAVRDGADGIELDVRLSRDGVPVVIHDSNVSNTRLRHTSVSRMTGAQLKQVDAGKWFNRRHPELARLEYSRQTIPTLDEVLALVAKHENERSIVYIEMKCGRSNKYNDALARATVEAVQRHHLQTRSIIISFNLRTVAKIKGLDASLRTGALFGRRQAAVKSPVQLIAATIRCGAEEILLHHSIAKPSIIRKSVMAKLVPVLWTVNDPAWKERARKTGIGGLITNNPRALIGI